ncbi:hypothetical protein D9757_001579 [Collybiopsis confluens]|uniref:Dyp-type peroxidase n=1 Tax=Collybiopsis confluens TaxID=2823264 RepID=A0A8H5HZH5_9AGAR|nr:hypothetical protein D9757_001579 [Collybiopsis confluens]
MSGQSIYRIEHAHVRVRMVLSHGSSADGTPVVAWRGPNDYASQWWSIDPVDGERDTYMIRNTHTGSYMDLTGSSAWSGTKIIGYQRTGNPNQKWVIMKEQSGTGFWKIQSKATNTFANLLYGGSQTGTQIVGWEGSWDDGKSDGHQHWTLVRQGETPKKPDSNQTPKKPDDKTPSKPDKTKSLKKSEPRPDETKVPKKTEDKPQNGTANGTANETKNPKQPEVIPPKTKPDEEKDPKLKQGTDETPKGERDESKAPKQTDDDTPNLENIQAEIVPGLNKAYEYFLFFRFDKIDGFRGIMRSHIIPKISTAKQVFEMLKKKEFPLNGLPNPEWEYVGCSVGFSSIGLSKLGLDDYLYDEAFHWGQKRDARDLGDKGTEKEGIFNPEWEDKYLEEIHGVFQITAHNDTMGRAFVKQLKRDLQYAKGIKEVVYFSTAFRPMPYTRQEHFGFRDGISKPEIKGYTFDDELPIRDLEKERRPAWAVDGSFFVFRKLKQLVPEFNGYLRENGMKLFPNLPPEDASHKLGARMFGRWKSGTPVVLSPDKDDESISNDDKQVNNFQYSTDQKTCPFAAHTQKSFPRNNFPTSYDHLFRRASIPYGPELDALETSTTTADRGLLFLCYQSSIDRGFKYTQQRFNSPNFPSTNLQGDSPGYDSILGSSARFMTGANPDKPSEKLCVPLRFVEPRGGEYFFIPSISTLDKIAAGSHK